MRIPLIVASRAQVGVEYPRVVLRPGRWKFEHDITSSEVYLSTPTGDVKLHEELVLTAYTDVSILCAQTGSEPSITVYACLSV